MSDKLKRLAKNITELLPNTETPQETYYSLAFIMKKQRDYFQHFSPENIIKLIFYCYSFAKTKDFQLSDKMLNEIGFAVLIINSGDKHKEECDDCSGGGTVNCDVCDGNGRSECDECSGEGTVMCDECNGEGQIDVDGEMITCDECGGEGELTCGECDGEGTTECDYCNYGNQTCDTCSGEGVVETDEDDYTRNFIVTWNKFIKQRCEYTEGDTDILMMEESFDGLDDEYIKLNIVELSAEFADWVDSNEIYCTYYSDNPKMFVNNDMYLDTSSDKITAYTVK